MKAVVYLWSFCIYIFCRHQVLLLGLLGKMPVSVPEFSCVWNSCKLCFSSEFFFSTPYCFLFFLSVFINVSAFKIFWYIVKSSPNPLHSKWKEQYLVVITCNTIEILRFQRCFLLLVLNSLVLFMYEGHFFWLFFNLEQDRASTEIQTLILL